MAEEPSSGMQAAEALILQAPPGQVKFVAADVAKLLDGGLGDAAPIFRKFHLAAATLVPTPDSHVLVSEAGELGPGTFLDTKTRKTVQVNFVEQTMKAGTSPADAPATAFDAAVEELRTSLVDATRTHVETLHKSALIRGFEVYSKDGAITLLISCLAANLHNFWTGHWLSMYTITPGAGSATISGKTTIKTHYFENGNVQMENAKEHSATVSFDSPAAFGPAVIRAVAAAGDDLQTALDEMYENMAAQTLKEIRRFLPVSGQRFHWNIHAHDVRTSFMDRK